MTPRPTEITAPINATETRLPQANPLVVRPCDRVTHHPDPEP
jgi:hypothetical protein